jgi:hypothetical protein
VDISDPDVAAILSSCPNLNNYRWRATSAKSVLYNCIGWAMGEMRNWWPVYYYWPPGASRAETVEACREAFEQRGFELCDSPSLESGFIKVAIYAQGGELTHAARQLPGGEWTSKLGMLEDIQHETLEALECSEYGKVALIMRKPAELTTESPAP